MNARKLLRRRAEIEARLRNSAVDIVCIQETWLSDDVEAVSLGGYFMVRRLDRADGPKKGYGGVAIFAHPSLSCIALLEHLNSGERSWATLHSHIGAVLVGNLYRPPDDDDGD